MPDKPPSDPADHARDFAQRYAEPLDYHAAQAMIELGIPRDKIGANDSDHGFRHAAFHPTETTGGSITPDGRITIDSGVMNPELMTGSYGEKAAARWRSLRLRPRLETTAAHEHMEHETGSHDGAVEHGPDTLLPVSQGAREMLRAMKEGWKK